LEIKDLMTVGKLPLKDISKNINLNQKDNIEYNAEGKYIRKLRKIY